MYRIGKVKEQTDNARKVLELRTQEVHIDKKAPEHRTEKVLALYSKYIDSQVLSLYLKYINKAICTVNIQYVLSRTSGKCKHTVTIQCRHSSPPRAEGAFSSRSRGHLLPVAAPALPRLSSELWELATP